MPFPPRTLERLLPALYERNYRVWRGRGRQYKDLFGETPKWSDKFLLRNFTSLPEEIQKMRADPAVGRMLDEWLRDLDKAMKQVWLNVRNGDHTGAVKNLRVMVDIIRRYASQHPDFNIPWKEVESGFYVIGVRWQGSRYDNAKLEARNVNWDWLESNAGEGPMPSPNAIRPNAERGGSSILTPTYFRQWFIYTSKETFHAVETRREWPRPDEARPLGPLTITVKNRPFSDRITRPHLAEHEVIGCASAVAGFFDMLKNPNAAALLHGIVREPATGILQRVSQWFDEGKIAVDKTHLEWHHALEEKEGEDGDRLIDPQRFIDSIRRSSFAEAIPNIEVARRELKNLDEQLQNPQVKKQMERLEAELDYTRRRFDYLITTLASGQAPEGRFWGPPPAGGAPAGRRQLTPEEAAEIAARLEAERAAVARR